MDIYCPVCSEPWDNDELHYLVEETPSVRVRARNGEDVVVQMPDYRSAYAAFRAHGCQVFGNGRCEPTDAGRDVAIIQDMLGDDDPDGAAAMCEELLGLGIGA